MTLIGKARHGRASHSASQLYRNGLPLYSRAVTAFPKYYEPLNKMRCKPNMVKLLQLIEARSMNHGGETKWYTKEMAQEIGVTERTIYNYLKVLHRHKYISVLTDNRFSKHRRFYSIRVIRCNRIVMAKDMVVHRGQLFRVDIRPQPGVGGYMPGTPMEFIMKPPKKGHIQLALEGKYDLGSDGIYSSMLDRAENGDPMALRFLGSRFRFNRGDAFQ